MSRTKKSNAMKAEPRLHTPPVALVIVDDQTLVRDGLVRLWSQRSELKIVGHAGSSEELFAALDTVPDVAVLDTRLNKTGAFADVSAWRRRFPKTRLLMLDESLHESHVRQVLRMKLAGYMLKSDPLRELTSAVELVAAGRFAVSQKIRGLIQEVDDGRSLMLDGAFVGLPTLTVRETEMLVYLAQGLPLQECSQLTNLSLGSIDSYKARIMRKLKARHMMDLSRLALSAGLMPY